MVDQKKAQVLVRQQQQVLWVQINRPETHNALNMNVIDHFMNVLVSASDDIKVIFIHGSDAAFCSGMDLKEYRKQKEVEGQGPPDIQKNIGKLMSLIVNHHALIIACVESVMCGGGLGLAACCDLVLATQQAKGSLPELKHNILPEQIMPFLKMRVQKYTILRWLIQGDFIGVHEMKQEGLIDKIFDSKKGLEKWCDDLTTKVSSMSFEMCNLKTLVRCER